MLFQFLNRLYRLYAPALDYEELANGQERIMLRHDRGKGPLVFVAPKGELTSGWVIGLVVGKTE